MRGQPAFAVQGPQPYEQGARFLEGGGGGRVQQGESGRVPGAPAGEVEGESGEVGFQNLRAGEWDKGAGLSLVPQAVAYPWLRPSRSPAPLIGGGPADPHGLQPRQAARGIEARDPGEATVDHHPHALDGQAGLGDGGGQHHLSPAWRRWRDGAVLLGKVESPIEWRDDHVRPGRPFGEQAFNTPDLGLAGQEHQDGSGLLGQGLAHGPGRLILSGYLKIASQIAGFNRILAALAFDDRRLAQQPRHPGPVQRG